VVFPSIPGWPPVERCDPPSRSRRPAGSTLQHPGRAGGRGAATGAGGAARNPSRLPDGLPVPVVRIFREGREGPH
jgi:hypothetical protein